MGNDQKELKKALFRQLVRLEDIGQISISYRRSFLTALFTVSLAFLVGLLTVDLKVILNWISIGGVFVMSLNLFIIPIYFWLVSTNEIGELLEKIELLKNKYEEEPVITEATIEERNKFNRLFRKKSKGTDLLFDFIVSSFLVGLATFIISLLPQMGKLIN
ncbi:hypothetical protein KKD19_01315 [Patescibacteria group bacterium]|nr:hypothetical protein [Patescibacteria group bacterium]MBU4511872.1 hypothetical protein [Patescibacteria group bacterium]